ncbi:hypothetical protein D3C78_1652890 [compost metagenome]
MPSSNAGRSDLATPSFSRIGVSVGPGLNTLTRIFLALNSSAQARAKAPIAALVPE